MGSAEQFLRFLTMTKGRVQSQQEGQLDVGGRDETRDNLETLGHLSHLFLSPNLARVHSKIFDLGS